MIKNIMKNIGPKQAGVKAELFNALKNHKKTPGYNYSDFDEKDIDDFLEVAKTDMPNASPDELKNELISRYENAAKLTAPTGLSEEQWKTSVIAKLDTSKLLEMDKNFENYKKTMNSVDKLAQERNDIVKAELRKRNSK